MKNIFLSILFFTATLVSCSSDSNEESSINNKITPPNWIQGTWAQKSGSPGEYTFTNTLRFKANDFCSLNGNSENCFNQIIQASNGQTTTEQIITNNEYKLVINNGGFQTTTYHFYKMSDTKIEYVMGDDLPNMELIKQ